MLDEELIEPQTAQELVFQTNRIKEVVKSSMDWFGGVALPDVATLKFPSFYLSLWIMVTSVLDKPRDFSKFALGLPRGHGKTMVVKLIILFAILFSKKRYIMIIGANKDKAVAIVSDICDMLDSPNIQKLFGNWRGMIEKDSAEKKVFTFQGREIIIEAAGYGTAIRGAQQKNSRPDFIVLDDAQTKECAESLQEAKSFRNWFRATVLKLKNPTNCTYMYIGNMYKDMEIEPNSGLYTCMLRNLQRSKQWTSFIVGAILQDGTALWEELHPLNQLLEEYEGDLEAGQEDVFFAEVLNDPTPNASKHFDPSKMVVIDRESDDIHQGSFMVIDPATSKLTPDQIVFTLSEMYDRKPHVKEFEVHKVGNLETAYLAVKFAAERQCSLIVVESNAYQYALAEAIQHVLDVSRISGIQVYPIYSSKSKNGRILGSMKSVTAGNITFSRQAALQYKHQAIGFDPSKTTNLDDILDSVTMVERISLNSEAISLMTLPGESYQDLDNLDTLGSSTVTYSNF